MAPLLKDAKHTTRPYSSRFSRAKIELDGGELSSSFLPLKHEVCFALPSFHESRDKDDFPRSGRAERRDQWKTRTALFTIKKRRNVTLGKRIREHQTVFILYTQSD